MTRPMSITGVFFVLLTFHGCAAPPTSAQRETVLDRRIAVARDRWRGARTLTERRDACIAAIDQRLIANRGDFGIVLAVFGPDCEILKTRDDGSGYARVDLTPKEQRPPPGWVFGEWYFHVDFAPNGTAQPEKKYVVGYSVSNWSAKDVWTPPSGDR